MKAINYIKIKYSKSVIWFALLAMGMIGCKMPQYTYKNRDARLQEQFAQEVAEYRASHNLTTETKEDKVIPAQPDKPNYEEAAELLNADEPVALAVREANQYLGVKYRTGGTDKKGMDCSGLTYTSYKAAGINLPRVSRSQATYGTKVTRENVKVGDLVFFTYPGGTRITHVGMIAEINGGKTLFIHASSSRGVVKDDFNSNYWKKIFVTARRPHK